MCDTTTEVFIGALRYLDRFDRNGNRWEVRVPAKPAAQEEPDDESSLEDLLQKNKANNV